MSEPVKPKRRLMTPKEWAEIRAKWEADPRDGYLWIVREMELPVGDKAVRKRAIKESWAKKISLKTIVERAQAQADARFRESGVTDEDRKVTDGESIDLRAEVIETHRREWKEHRDGFPLESVVEMTPGDPTSVVLRPDGEKLARTAKTFADAIRTRQQGEREAWGLDAVASDDGAGMATLDELNAMYDLAMRKAAEMDAAVKQERGAPDAPD